MIIIIIILFNRPNDHIVQTVEESKMWVESWQYFVHDKSPNTRSVFTIVWDTIKKYEVLELHIDSMTQIKI